MITLFKRLWTWLKSLLGGNRQQKRNKDLKPFTETDYEFLFFQLLDGVAHGWHGGRIVRFFEQLGEQGKTRRWVTWLEGYQEKVLASSVPNLQLAARLMRLGELAAPFPKIEPIGTAAYEMGRQLYLRQANSEIWEYDGPDVNPLAISSSSTDTELETITLEELTSRIQQDETLASQLKEQLNLSEETDHQSVIDALVQQFTTSQHPTDQPQPPETVDQWFNQGLQQAQLGDLEGAIAAWDQALALNPQLSQAWHNRGNALANLGKKEEALDSLEQALALNPQDPQAWNTKAHVFYEDQQWQEAIACWNQVIELQPAIPQVWYNQACAWDNLNNSEKAIEGYKQVLALDPDFEPAKERLAELSNPS